MINCHFHDDRSSDGKSPLAQHCEAATAAGVRHICVTNHAEVMGSDGSWTADLDEMRDRFQAEWESVLSCRDRFPDLGVQFGIELEYRREWTETFDRLTSEVSFDFVLGSVHLVDGINVSGGPDTDQFFEGRSQEAAYSSYFREVADMVAWGGFDAVAHFDVVKRYGYRHYGSYDPEQFQVLIQPVLEHMVEQKIGIEINTSGVFGPGTPYPELQILEWARQTGVPALTIGTDSHKPAVFGQGLAEGIALASAGGWQEFTIFERRRPRTRVPISKAEAWAADRSSAATRKAVTE